ncbi:site-specific DNA-methyltransferase [Leptotrichia hongkongensis]|jgi:Adenine specific DNA methylase Mod|uniref:site-specific DNA-methyltransferase n=1 Tax=Leptotrichia hongkongensis TaxID=554406 RepID=UPI0035A8DE5B
MSKKLELHWIGKDKEILVEPRILIENKELSNIENDENTENMLIHGDNLLALKALEQKYAGKIKCIYIDPPYNIAAATPYYDDNIANSEWLNLMKKRIELLWKLLKEDGLLAVQIDDELFAKLYLLMEEICSQKNMKIICVKMSESTGVKMASVNKAGSIPKIKEFIILAKKDGIKKLNLEMIPKDKWDSEYKILIKGVTKQELEFIKEFMGNGDLTKESIEKANMIASKIEFSTLNEILDNVTKEEIEKIKYENSWRIARDVAVSGTAKKIADELKENIKGSCFFVITKQNKKYLMKKEYNSNSSQPRCKLLFADQYLTINPGDLWTDIKTTGLDNEGNVDFPKGKKPEKLIKRIIQLNTNENDIVLDSFLGSGTTAAVAHKMNRKYIGIEMGGHAYTHCKVRLDKVIAGEDKGGITKNVNWQGGGAYRFYELAPTLINEDKFGEMVINKEYSPEMLANAVALHEGYNFNPNKEIFWKQSKSTENSYLFVTTKYVDINFLNSIKNDMEDEEYLVIACKNYDKVLEKKYSNIEIKKIPEMLLEKCEFNVENYNLNIINTPIYEKELGSESNE